MTVVKVVKGQAVVYDEHIHIQIKCKQINRDYGAAFDIYLNENIADIAKQLYSESEFDQSLASDKCTYAPITLTLIEHENKFYPLIEFNDVPNKAILTDDVPENIADIIKTVIQRGSL